jgi:hypothetical protein
MLYSTEPFGRALATAVMAGGYVRRNNSPDWVGFVEALPSIGYETLRKAVTGERTPSERLIRAAAATLSLEPTFFTEFRLMLARHELDPARVGWQRASSALASWERWRADEAGSDG